MFSRCALPLLLAVLIGPIFAEEAGPLPPAPPPDWTVKVQPVPGGDAPHALAGFPDGSALLVFRGRADGGVRDIQVANRQDGHWSDPRTLVPDGWKPAEAPLAAPALAIRGSRAAAAWYTVVDNRARIQLSLSSDAGRIWQIPLCVNEEKPAPVVAVVVLRDESEIVCWEEGPRLLLRRISPQDVFGPLTPVADLPQALDSVRLTVLTDQDENAPPELLLSYVAGGRPASLVVALPSAKKLADEDNTCECARYAPTASGFALKGTVVSLDAAAGIVVARHEEIPGVMKAMTMPFKAVPAVLKTLAPGREFFGRMEEHDNEWWLSDVRLIAGSDGK